MNLKEFFKPKLGKIILAIIFFLVGLFVFGLSMGFGYSNPPLFYLSLIFIWPFFLIYGIFFKISVNMAGTLIDRIVSIFGIILTIFYNYVLACLIIYLFKKKK